MNHLIKQYFLRTSTQKTFPEWSVQSARRNFSKLIQSLKSSTILMPIR
uniref:Uncharacterized protein n=1 Tax=Anguilla anguilla TaxID=7936 RepID=A0A0E9RFS2_ANGAN